MPILAPFDHKVEIPFIFIAWIALGSSKSMPLTNLKPIVVPQVVSNVGNCESDTEKQHPRSQGRQVVLAKAHERKVDQVPNGDHIRDTSQGPNDGPVAYSPVFHHK